MPKLTYLKWETDMHIKKQDSFCYIVYNPSIHLTVPPSLLQYLNIRSKLLWKVMVDISIYEKKVDLIPINIWRSINMCSLSAQTNNGPDVKKSFMKKLYLSIEQSRDLCKSLLVPNSFSYKVKINFKLTKSKTSYFFNYRQCNRWIKWWTHRKLPRWCRNLKKNQQKWKCLRKWVCVF